MIRKSLMYLLIMLLPIQAVAMSCLSICKDMHIVTHDSPAQMATPMDHCANMGASTSVDNPLSHHKSPNCWLGSVCLVQAAVFAVPIQHRLLSMKRESPTYPAVTIHYRSVALGNLQRPPATL